MITHPSIKLLLIMLATLVNLGQVLCELYTKFKFLYKQNNIIYNR
jgi:hypothetical protein